MTPEPESYPSDLLVVSEVSRRLGRSRGFFYELIRTGELRVWKELKGRGRSGLNKYVSLDEARRLHTAHPSRDPMRPTKVRVRTEPVIPPLRVNPKPAQDTTEAKIKRIAAELREMNVAGIQLSETGKIVVIRKVRETFQLEG